jgi:hypothetical protein
MYLEDLYDDGKNCGLSLEDVKAHAIKQALMQYANPNSALAKAWVEMKLNPPPPFESDDDGGDDVHDSGDEVWCKPGWPKNLVNVTFYKFFRCHIL